MSAPHLATPSDAERAAAATEREATAVQHRRTAEHRVQTLTAQVARLERFLCEIASRPAIPTAVRQDMLRVLTSGTRGRPSIIPTPQEQRLVNTYRQLDDRRKRLLSSIASAFAEPSSRRRRVTR